ncbi:MAG: hypothetical protein P8Y54_08290 [Xanthomonadales bacterium]
MPPPIFLVADATGDVLLDHRVVAGQVKLADLEIGHQAAVHEQATADAGAERDRDHDPAHTLARAEAHFRQPGGVRVVEHHDRASGGGGKPAIQGLADPVGKMVGGGRGQHDAAGHGGRKADPDRPRVVEELHQPGDRGGHGVEAERGRRPEPLALRDEFTAGEIHQRALDAAAADVDTQHVRFAHGSNDTPGSGLRVHAGRQRVDSPAFSASGSVCSP